MADYDSEEPENVEDDVVPLFSASPSDCAGLPASIPQTLQQDFERLQHRHTKLRRSNQILSKQICMLKKRKRLQEQKLQTFLSKDQISKLGQSSSRGSFWRRATIIKALQLKFSCGNSGYDALRAQRYPLPSLRTLNRRLQSVKFKSGILEEVFDMLKVKVDHMNDNEKLCCLALDEMSITPGFQYDKTTNSQIGEVTLPNHKGTATHGLVFMLGGISSRWKQTVAYYFTGNSTRGAEFKPIVISILEKASSIGLHVCCDTTDMGSSNVAMWKEFGVQCTKNNVVNRIAHPCSPNEYLYFCPDVPHLLKNIRSALLSNKVIYLNLDHKCKYSLPSTEVKLDHLQAVASLQSNRELKMAPKLTEDLLSPGHFDKMKVGNAFQLLGREISATMRYMIQFHGWSEEMETTAWFLDFNQDWFKYMSSRHPVLALSELSVIQYQQAVAFLKSVVDVFFSLRIGNSGKWKPIQTGVIMATTTILQIHEELI